MNDRKNAWRSSRNLKNALGPTVHPTRRPTDLSSLAKPVDACVAANSFTGELRTRRAERNRGTNREETTCWHNTQKSTYKTESNASMARPLGHALTGMCSPSYYWATLEATMNDAA
uniref:Uncharacterized protein n=1 Tax=Ascaris lumbricoides TaxID=6252 RepID=A0A0M3HST7_ASCLU